MFYQCSKTMYVRELFANGHKYGGDEVENLKKHIDECEHCKAEWDELKAQESWLY